MQSERFIVEPSFGCPFHTEAIHFVTPRSYDDGLTLLFFHATNLCKEALTPLVTELLEISPPLSICDAWVIDNPNHGRSADLNRSLLASDKYRENWTPEETAGAAYALLATRTHGVDFSKRKLVVVSQSGGSLSAVMLYKTHPELPIHGFIMMDPAILPTDKPSTPRIMAHFKKTALLKNDLWTSKDEARRDLLNKGGFRSFAPAAFEAFMECALRPLGDEGAVTLASTKVHDYVFHASDEVVPVPSAAFVELCEEDKIPVHLIVALKDEFKGMTRDLKAFQRALVARTTHGAEYIIEEGSHLFPQVQPSLAARHVRTALLKISNWQGARL